MTEDQRIALVEYIAHLTMEDWEGVAGDLVKLGFMPEGTLPAGAEKVIAPIMEQVRVKHVAGLIRNGMLLVVGQTCPVAAAACSKLISRWHGVPLHGGCTSRKAFTPRRWAHPCTHACA